jgi:malonyl CoA-acyl carrier protein transacylase
MIAFLFPGQGSQHRGMGQQLFDAVPEYRELEPLIDAELGYSLRDLCVKDAHDQLRRTQYTQPALYTVNALHFLAAKRKGQNPEFLAGHSLGEYNALHAADAFDFMTGLRLVKRRAQIMAAADAGGMAAVVGLAPERVLRVLADAGLGALDVAGYNSAAQTVISGPQDAITRAGGPIERAGASMYVPLPVSAAFHSRYMSSAAATFAHELARTPIQRLTRPVIANVDAKPYSMDDPAAVRDSLAKQIYHPVLWLQSVRWLLSHGTTTFAEIGPGNVLARLVADIRRNSAAA